MPLFRRRDETLNEILLQQAHLDEPQAEQPADAAHGVWYEVLRGAYERPGRYDVDERLELSGLPGETIEFATLPDGDLLVEVADGDPDLSQLADAVEQEIDAPYRVVARRVAGDDWKVLARELDVVELTFRGGDGIELVCERGVRELRVDGERSDTRIPELDEAEQALGDDFVVQADRLDGDLWEVRASPL